MADTDYGNIDPLAGADSSSAPDPSTIAGPTPMQQQPPDVSGSSVAPAPDALVNQLPATSNPPVQAPTVNPSAPKPSMWLQVVQGALSGLAGSAGATHFGGGLAMGAAAQQQAQQQKTFADIQSADRAAQAARVDKQMHQEDEQMQMRRDDHAMQTVKFNKEVLGIEYEAIPNTGTNAKQYLDQSVSNSNGNGASVPAGIVMSPTTIFIPKAGANTAQVQTSAYNKMAPVLGLPVMPDGQNITPEAYQSASNQFMGHDRSGGLFDPKQLPSQIANMKANLDNYSKSPTKNDQVLAQGQNTLKVMQAQLDGNNKNEADAAAQKEQALGPVKANNAGLEEKAKLPYELSKVRAEQAAKDGDPNSAGQLLVNGDVAPSQIISARNPAFAQAAFTAAKKANPNWNAQQAEGYFKAAGAPSNVNFFGSAKSLTDPGGTLDQLATNFKDLPNGKIPAYNKMADWTAAAAGSGATAKFAQTAIGVADDYAKVMGGGTGSDSGREEVLKSFAQSHSQAGMDGAIQAARDAVASQTNSRIGSNPVMQRMYGSPKAKPQVAAGQQVTLKNGSTVTVKTINPDGTFTY